jgi:hypothetical protein
MSDDPDWIDELYAEGAEELPPAALDERIRAAAREPVRHPWYRNPGRLTALATAASLVIAVSVIYFEPDQPALEAPAPALESPLQQRKDLDEEIMVEREAVLPEAVGVTAADRPSEEAPMDAASDRGMKIEAAERKSMPARRSINTPAASLAADAVTPDSPAASPAQNLAPDQQPEATGAASPSGRSMESAEADTIGEVRFESAVGTAIVSKESAARELIRLCGALPGEEQSREIVADGAGWLVTVTVGDDVRSWRCVDGAWIEEASEQ